MLTGDIVKSILMQKLTVQPVTSRYSAIGGIDAAVDAIMLASIRNNGKLNNKPQNCPVCQKKYEPKAHHTGDGWILWWECLCGDEVDMEWPFGDGQVGTDTLERHGFEIV